MWMGYSALWGRRKRVHGYRYRGSGRGTPRKIRWRLQVLGHKKTADRCGELTKILKLEFEQREWVVPEPDQVNR